LEFPREKSRQVLDRTRFFKRLIFWNVLERVRSSDHEWRYNNPQHGAFETLGIRLQKRRHVFNRQMIEIIFSEIRRVFEQTWHTYGKIRMLRSRKV
jgi:hypothetical protein